MAKCKTRPGARSTMHSYPEKPLSIPCVPQCSDGACGGGGGGDSANVVGGGGAATVAGSVPSAGSELRRSTVKVPLAAPTRAKRWAVVVSSVPPLVVYESDGTHAAAPSTTSTFISSPPPADVIAGAPAGCVRPACSAPSSRLHMSSATVYLPTNSMEAQLLTPAGASTASLRKPATAPPSVAPSEAAKPRARKSEGEQVSQRTEQERSHVTSPVAPMPYVTR
eukprot:scaffold123514_cov63-Phaeocystis_antarctica.AAC.2